MKNILILEHCIVIAFILSSTACSSDLSRGDASVMIQKVSSPETLSWIKCNVDLKTCFVNEMILHPTKKDKEGFSRLEHDGFIKMKQNNRIVSFDLNDKAKNYTRKLDTGFDAGAVLIVTGAVSHVEVTGISKPSDVFGQRICTATYIVHYQLTPFGEILAKDEVNLSRRGEAMFVLYDDGWRIAK